jgi:hypothetical protein
MTNKKKKLGIIQSRGLGDLVIALPIAHHFYKEGWDVYWPIEESFLWDMQEGAPWVHWIPVPYDQPGRYFYDVPMERLRNFKVDETLCLYQHLTGHNFSEEKYFQYTSFDQYKYIKAGVPFLDKWRLAECITRNPEREQSLRAQVVTNPNYVVAHLEGSTVKADFDRSIIPPEWQIIEISKIKGHTIWDWISVIQGAQSIICVDSVYANLVDQLGLGSDRYFIQRSHIGLTPVQGQDWTWI